MFHCHGNHRESLRPNVTGYLAWRKLVGVEPFQDHYNLQLAEITMYLND